MRKKNTNQGVVRALPGTKGSRERKNKNKKTTTRTPRGGPPVHLKPFMDSIPSASDKFSPKEKTLYNLAVLANAIVAYKNRPDPADGGNACERYTNAVDCLEDLRKFAERYESRAEPAKERVAKSLAFLDETLYLGCDQLEIRFELGEALENIKRIKRDLAQDAKQTQPK
jgi:hypothetical protein